MSKMKKQVQRVLTIDATKAVTPLRVRTLVRAMLIENGEEVVVEIVGRDAGPRCEYALALADRMVRAHGGVPLMPETAAA